ADGTVEVVNIKPCMMLGAAALPLRVVDTKLTLNPGDTVILYSDGYHEATAPDGKTQFGIEGLRDAVGEPRTALPLEEGAAEVTAQVRQFTGGEELQDDQTMLLLRRRA